jgi:spore maturation protein CgeB
MKILYIGFLSPGSTAQERLDAIAGLGHDVMAFDMWSCVLGANRITASLMGRYQWGARIAQSNRDLLTFASAKKFDIVWVDKGTWLYAETLAEVRAMSRRKLAVHFSPDAQILDNRTRHYVRAIPIYDMHVTTKPFEVEPIKSLGGKQVELVLQGYGAKFGRVTQAMAREDLRSEICFIGHSQPHYRSMVKAVAQLNFDFKIWGPKWPRWARVSSSFRPLVQGAGLWGDDYPTALVSSKIALAFLSKFIPETTTTRTFEIPATGSFMLAERTDEHLALFEEGKEAEFFGSREELQDKVRFYMAQDVLRQRIAAGARARSIASHYDLPSQLNRILLPLSER